MRLGDVSWRVMLYVDGPNHPKVSTWHVMEWIVGTAVIHMLAVMSVKQVHMLHRSHTSFARRMSEKVLNFFLG